MQKAFFMVRAQVSDPADRPGFDTWYANDHLPQAVSNRLVASGKYVALQQDEVVYRQDAPTAAVYFPTRGCCCHVVTLGEGRTIETVTVGNEGMVGVNLALGLDWNPLSAVALVPGESLRVPTEAFMEIFRESEELEKLIRKYAVYCMRYESQIVACNALHSVEQRACRRLLMAHDRVGNSDFELTQERLSEMLGVRRQTIAGIAATLQAAEVISYRRGVIKILDRRGLEAASCECYEVAKTAYDAIVMR